MHTRPLSPFGTEVFDIDVGSISVEQAASVRELIGRARVAVFREQLIDDAGLLRFLRALGEITFTEGETPLDGAPGLNEVSNVGRKTPPRSVFHTDTSYVARPPAFTALRAVCLPTHVGATLFSDQVAALETLPKRCRSPLQGCSVRHRVTGLDGRSEEISHPLFTRHPVTGEAALYLSTPERCVALSGFDDAIGARIIRMLYRHSIRPSRLYQHAWQQGDVLVWDNRVTMHRADHHEVVGDRVLHRGMVAGEVPIAAW